MSDELKPESIYSVPLSKYPAFPVVEEPPLTKRDHFAGLAMQGMLAGRTNASDEEIAFHSFAIADAMIAEQEKQKSPDKGA